MASLSPSPASYKLRYTRRSAIKTSPFAESRDYRLRVEKTVVKK